jgi:hypothetical protein
MYVIAELLAAAAIPPAKERPFPIEWEMDRVPELTWTLWRKEKFLVCTVD